MLDAMEEKTFTTGNEIIRQGDPGDFYYVLYSGSCDIFKDGKLVLQVL
jgi:CRP-like cAMP-binding protein